MIKYKITHKSDQKITMYTASLFANSKNPDWEILMEFEFDEEKTSYLNKIEKMVLSSPELQEILKKIWAVRPNFGTEQEIKEINERALRTGLEDKKSHIENLS